jgi:hypothetical protein
VFLKRTCFYLEIVCDCSTPCSSQQCRFQARELPFVVISLSAAEGGGGSIVSDYGLDDRGSIPVKGTGFFF